MDASEFVAWRKANGISQARAAEMFSKARVTIARWEAGTTPIPPEIQQTVRPSEFGDVIPLPVKVRVFDPDAAGLIPCPPDPPFPKRDWDRFPVGEGWQRIGWRVVNASIPDPIDYFPPEWAGWRGVITASGRVYDYETGHIMTMRDPLSGRSFIPNSEKPGGGFQKLKNRPRADRD